MKFVKQLYRMPSRFEHLDELSMVGLNVKLYLGANGGARYVVNVPKKGGLRFLRRQTKRLTLMGYLFGECTRCGRPIPNANGWYVDTGTRDGSGGKGLMGPFKSKSDADDAAHEAALYHNAYRISDADEYDVFEVQ